MARKATGTCNLCFKDRELVKSHVIPNWSSKLSGRASEYVKSPPDILALREAFKSQKPQGRVGEYLFCLDCNNIFSKGQGLLREMVHPSTVKSSSLSPIKDFTIELRDEEAIKDFYTALGGLLLKGHISNQGGWKDFILTKKQRNLVFNSIKDASLSQKIQISLFKIYNLNNIRIGNFADKIKDLNEFLPFDFQHNYQPVPMTYGGFATYYAFGGLVLSMTFHTKDVPYKLSTNPSKIPIHPLDIRYLMKQDEVWSVPNMLYHLEESTIIKVFNAIASTPLYWPCPCKVHYTTVNGVKGNLKFGDCCYKYWSIESLYI